MNFCRSLFVFRKLLPSVENYFPRDIFFKNRLTPDSKNRESVRFYMLYLYNDNLRIRRIWCLLCPSRSPLSIVREDARHRAWTFSARALSTHQFQGSLPYTNHCDLLFSIHRQKSIKIVLYNLSAKLSLYRWILIRKQNHIE